jgi:CPA1 family monovalent cation:H+ antiporter
MSETVRHHLDTFWELIDEILNAVLFLLIGMEVLVLPFTVKAESAGLIMIPLVLFARWISVSGTITILKLRRDFTKGVVPILTWGGLRGGISVALALSLPASGYRSTILVMTYAVVVFSIIVQGLTVGPLVRRILAKKPG